MKNLFASIVVGSILSIGSVANAGTTFVESYTDAYLGDGDDTVLSVVGVGYSTDKGLEGVIGVGYDESSNGVALRSEVRYYRYLGKSMTLEAGVEGIMTTAGDDQFVVRPEVRIRKYLF